MTHAAVIIGTGFSGLCMAIKLKERGIEDFIILEKESDIGGTWRENTYPGAECDIPSALYSYSFEPYPEWEYKWSMQPQILQYINHVADKHELRDHILFGEEVISAIWLQDSGIWQIKTKAGKTYQSTTLITAIGQLHHPSIPKFKNIDQLSIPHFHSAQWDHDIDLSGKKVGVIGNAASAVQFIPEIAKVAQELIVFQRSANWMLPKQDRMYKDWEKKLVRRLPFLLKLYRLKIWLLGGGLFFLMQNGNQWLRKLYQAQSLKFIKDHIKDENLVKALTPLFPMGAKRVLFSDTYYPALAREHVSVITSEIQALHPSGVQTSGKSYDVDVLVFGTGFITNPFLKEIEVTGVDDRSIRDVWSTGSQNYLGISVHGFPNMFMMYGPNTNLGHNSIIIMSEAQANYIAQCIQKMKDDQLKSMDVKKDIMAAYYQETQERLNQMIWATVGESWYRSADGSSPNNYPGRTMEYIRKTKKVDWSKYDMN